MKHWEMALIAHMGILHWGSVCSPWVVPARPLFFRPPGGAVWARAPHRPAAPHPSGRYAWWTTSSPAHLMATHTRQQPINGT